MVPPRDSLALRNPGLELTDGGLQLRDRGADVWQLDNVRFWTLGQLPQLSECITNSLLLGEKIREGGDNSACQRDVSGFHPNADGPAIAGRRGGVIGCEGWGFVRLGIDDRPGCSSFAASSFSKALRSMLGVSRVLPSRTLKGRHRGS